MARRRRKVITRPSLEEIKQARSRYHQARAEFLKEGNPKLKESAKRTYVAAAEAWMEILRHASRGKYYDVEINRVADELKSVPQ